MIPTVRRSMARARLWSGCRSRRSLVSRVAIPLARAGGPSRGAAVAGRASRERGAGAGLDPQPAVAGRTEVAASERKRAHWGLAGIGVWAGGGAGDAWAECAVELPRIVARRLRAPGDGIGDAPKLR